MPCYSDDQGAYYRAEQAAKTRTRIAELTERVGKLEAMLCGVLTLLEKGGPDEFAEIVDYIDWAEAGINKTDLLDWWDNHKREDAERRATEKKAEAARKAKETKARKQRELRENALSKLTPAERKALRIK